MSANTCAAPTARVKVIARYLEHVAAITMRFSLA